MILLERKKIQGPSDFLSENQLIGPQKWIDFLKNPKTLGTTTLPGIKVSANQRPVCGNMTIYWPLIVGFINTIYLSQK